MSVSLGALLWENSAFVSPNLSRAALLRQKSSKYVEKVAAKAQRKDFVAENSVEPDELADTFA